MEEKNRTLPDGSPLPSMGTGVTPLSEREEWWVDSRYGGPIFEEVLDDVALSRLLHEAVGDGPFAILSAATHHYLTLRDRGERHDAMRREIRENARRHDQLEHAARALNVRCVNLEGGCAFAEQTLAGNGALMIEKLLLVAGIGRDDALRLATAHGQQAFAYKDDNGFVLLDSSGLVKAQFTSGQFTVDRPLLERAFSQLANARARQFVGEGGEPTAASADASHRESAARVSFLRFAESGAPGALAARTREYLGRGDLMPGIFRKYVVTPVGLDEATLKMVRSATFLEEGGQSGE